MAAMNWVPSVALTASGRPVFLPGEVERYLLPSVDLESEENPSLVPLRSGLLVLTSHRLIWSDDGLGGAAASGYAIPHAAIVHTFQPKKRSIFASPRVRIQLSMTPDGVVAEKGRRSEVITVVMRGKTDPDVFYGRLQEALRARAWEAVPEGTTVTVDGAASGGNAVAASAAPRVRMPVVGVSGILRKEQELWESTDKSLQDAFQDLNALMSKAKEMVQLAEKMRLKLLSGPGNQGSANDEEIGSKQEMQDWLLSVGIVSPVTKESAGALYHQQLSRELADFVRLPLDKAGGMIALIDIYCIYNRARGTELISPEDLLQACSLWEKIDVQVMLRKFDSGVVVIQNKTHRDDEIFARISSHAQKPDALKMGFSPSDAAFTLGIAPALAKEHLLNAENKGLLCRDDSPDGLRFYINLLKDIDSSDIYLIKPHSVLHTWVSATSLSG